MNAFDTHLLLLPTVSIFLCTLIVGFFATNLVGLSIFFAFFKSGIFLLYYGVIFDGTYTFLDDWTYLEGGIQLVHEKIGFSNLIENWDSLLIVGRGDHFFYFLQNAYAIRIFGEGYFAPAALNSIITLGIAFIGKIISIREFSLSENSSRFLFFFLLAHPDILAWSTVMNGKDTTVLLLHLTLLLSISLFLRKWYSWSICIALPAIIILIFLRFYVPLVFALSLLLSIIVLRQKSNAKFTFFLLLILAGIVASIGSAQLMYSIELIRNNSGNPIFGLFRILLTPIPFNTESNYSFLDIPALFHWLLLPFAVIGVIQIFGIKTLFSRFFLIYFALFICLYSVFLELQGPRHRMQLDYAIAVFQFLGLSVLLNFSGRRKTRSDITDSSSSHTEKPR